MSIGSFVKDPDAVLDYEIDWTEWLDGDTISSAVSDASGDLVVDSTSHTSSKTVTWLSGGTAGKQLVTVHIVTTGGREDDRSIAIAVKER